MSPQLSEFGSWLRSYRKAAGLSQAALAKMVGAKRSRVSYWEYNGSRPKPKYVDPLCNALHIDRDEFNRMLNPGDTSGEEKASASDDNDPVVLPAVVTSVHGKIGCTICNEGTLFLCSDLVNSGLPVLCEAVTERDVQGAWASGGFDRLVESRDLACTIE